MKWIDKSVEHPWDFILRKFSEQQVKYNHEDEYQRSKFLEDSTIKYYSTSLQFLFLTEKEWRTFIKIYLHWHPWKNRFIRFKLCHFSYCIVYSGVFIINEKARLKTSYKKLLLRELGHGVLNL